MVSIKSTFVGCTLVALSVLQVSAAVHAVHFTITSDTNTDNTMTVLIKSSINPMIDGRAILPGDEIAVFDSIGLCCGVVTWPSIGGSRAINVWGQNPQVTHTDGMGGGERLRWRVWDSVLAKESPAKVTYYPPGDSYAISDSMYVYNGISVLSSLVGGSSAVLPHFDAQVNADVFLTGNTLNYSLIRPEEVNIAFFDLLGKCDLVIARYESSGIHRIGLQSLDLPSGRYMVRFKAGALSRELTLSIASRQF